MKRILIGVALLANAGIANAQLVVGQTLTPVELVQQVLLGSGVVATNITLNGVPGNTVNEQIGSYDGTGSNIGLPQGVMMSSGNIAVGIGPNVGGGTTLGGGNFGATDPDLEVLSGVAMNDRCVLEFDFIPIGDSIEFKYVFSSEEYNEYVCGTVNDAFGFFLSGPGITGSFSGNSIDLALIPGTSTPVTINTVNNGTVGNNGQLANCEALDPNWESNNIYYIDNAGGTTIEFDGFTVVLTARSAVQCGQTYHIKMAIADGGDTAFDSGVFLEGGSFTSSPFVPSLQPGPGIIGNTLFESCFNVGFIFTRTGDSTDVQTVNIEIGGTATPGVDYSPPFPTQLVFPAFVTQIPFVLNAPLDVDGLETIELILSSPSPCSADSIHVPFNFLIDQPDPLIAIGSAFFLDCGESVQLTPTITGGFGAYTYQWSTGSTASEILYTPTMVTDVTITVFDTCGLQTVGFFAVELSPPAPVSASLSGPQPLIEGCDQANLVVTRPAGTSGDLLVTTLHTGEAGVGTDYSITQPIVIPGGSATVSLPVVALEDNTSEGTESVVITVSYTNACSQEVTAEVSSSIEDAPSIVLTAEPFLIIPCGTDSVLITAEASGGVGTLSALWNNGYIGTTAYASNAVDGIYVITVTDDCGHTSSASITVDPQCAIVIPNVFSPNGDGDNDAFVIEGILASTNNVRIFNRWGQVVFEANNYANTWVANGLPDGTYFYEITVEREPEPFTGAVTILKEGRR
ncbi:MAG: gliding motility-associated C-terminal domain-containing protein [Flavobacteriales bacterium]|nr:gliding motility-associated C-terminal domain-containing protein [Flavobacteriales bacterium]